MPVSLRAEVTVRTHEDGLAALDALAPGWDRLAARSGLPHLSRAWAGAFLAHRLAPGEGWCALAAEAAGETLGVAVLVRSPHPRLGARRPRFRAPHDDHTWSGDVLLRREGARDVLGALLAALAAREPGLFSVTLPLVRASSPTLAALEGGSPFGVAVAAPAGLRSHAPVPASADALRAALGPQFRRNLRKASNRLGARGGARFVPAAEATAEHLAAFLALEASGWKGRGGTAIASDPALAAYYATLVRRLAAEGLLEWHVLDVDGAPAAMHLAARAGRTLTLAKIAYDERLSTLSPGNLLFERTLLREADARTADEVDCLTDMPWHRNWALAREPYRRVEVFPRRPLALAAGWAPAAARAAARSSPAVVRLARALRGEGSPAPARDGAEAPPGARRLLCVMRWPLGGIRTHLLYAYPRLFLAGWTATFVAPAGEAFDALARDLAGVPGAEFVPAPPGGGEARLAPVVRRLLAGGRFALVHSQGLGAAAQVEVARASLSFTGPRVPHVVTSHDVFPPAGPPPRRERLRRAALARLLARADAIVHVTDDARENLLEHLPRLRRSRARHVTIPHGVVVRAPPPADDAGTALRAAAGLPPDAFVLGFFGRFMEQKGFLPLLDALADVLRDGPPRLVRLVAVGSGDFEPEYRREVEARGLRDAVRFLPFAPDPAPLLRGVDLVVMPSLWEAAGLLAMEALVLGVPLLASDCPGLREVVRGTPALVARAGDRAAWADAIRRAAAHPPLEASRAFAREARRRYDAVASGEALRALLDEVSTARGPRRPRGRAGAASPGAGGS
jgi:glycosyltransferase involved in cell wall biosynthesis